MLEGLSTELETLSQLVILPALTASSFASWMIWKYRAQLREMVMSRRRIRDKRHGEWSLIANEFCLKLHQMKLEGKVHDWAYFTLIKKMRGIGMDLSIEPTFGTKPAYNFNPLKHPAVAKLKLKIKSRLQRNKKEAPVSKKKNALEEQFKHCKKAA